MTPDEIKANLTAEQWETYQRILDMQADAFVEPEVWDDEIKICKALAERNRLMKKHEWVFVDKHMGWLCLECCIYHKEKTDNMPHKPNCAIAAALKGIKADISWEKGVGE